jgi:hypothetical protein
VVLLLQLRLTLCVPCALAFTWALLDDVNVERSLLSCIIGRW